MSAEPMAGGEVVVATGSAMTALGAAWAGLMRAGDLVVLTGDLGAGKTTLTRGIGAALGVRGAVTSPTFVIARVHPAGASGLPLVHVDAYRLSSLAEVDDLDLDAAQEDSVTVVEWGAGLVEQLADARLEVEIHRPIGGDPDSGGEEPRRVIWRAYGARWAGVDLGRAASAAVRSAGVGTAGVGSAGVGSAGGDPAA
jgi:tRNA threonylcarbamoyladenosine biosynthesis protein TsaE